jgi:hypothetical protein
MAQMILYIYNTNIFFNYIFDQPLESSWTYNGTISALLYNAHVDLNVAALLIDPNLLNLNVARKGIMYIKSWKGQFVAYEDAEYNIWKIPDAIF